MADEVNLDDLVITEHARPYLVAQNGSIDFLKGDPFMWEAAYRQRLLKIFENIRPWLPDLFDSNLDVGCGMGGINILLAPLARGGRFTVGLLDGVDDPPEMHLHRETFSNFDVACRFLFANGVPQIFDATCTKVDAIDLVTSFGAWCFHFAPSVYIEKVISMSRRQPRAGRAATRLILEVRREKPEWRAELAAVFTETAVIDESKKWERIVYDCR